MNSDLSSLRVRDIGEQGLLERLQRFCPPDIIGDDAAVLETLPNQSLVVTTDILVDGVHFSNVTTSPEDAGWRAATANLSDLAAMGAFPLGITVGLGLPGDVSVDWVERLYQGMTECLQKYNVPIVGGDIVRSPITTLAITAFGQVNPGVIIRRSSAQVGDAIVVTGIHGASRAGLEILLHPEISQSFKTEEKAALIKAHQRPNPRLDVLPILQEILKSSCPIPVAGMDSSDGLADAVLQICRASKVGAIIEHKRIPMLSTLNQWVTAERILQYALYGGEDFELVLCLPPEPAFTLVQQLDAGAAIIGSITPGLTVILQYENEKIPDQVLSLSQGFQHF
ncbi:thiamine-phosphate kinase [Anabaena cylindrica FACHB-243]|uniref:Thiamine-monophosphate kinase n=1 Tax=Anabaena cylindrica (strain ATCC 27899 / PCC 7122) TaxID=272123 RepID=K9Z9M4_ANACC|nr:MULTISPECIES: thiamine-phosphate kinase [Anabaena]AFZ55871.1 thiamine-phosphate kinase [Anabaena cylindrica PCC 7122]MBD2421291.1 thiamine-phosphate kinase [Anabaena cylindrica FACHB-243]MBY5280861.1 thiamine-phosphate kinase [Anabaena sp. CCAP 1446/1C]MCM2406623.1 thiamine-phosphate kinase [Anabaena sp. CCAP 1446/1C]BAY01706.1 thiamine-monophosphate kinase [Anabaena cylindrica PCC 7122]